MASQVNHRSAYFGEMFCDNAMPNLLTTIFSILKALSIKLLKSITTCMALVRKQFAT